MVISIGDFGALRDAELEKHPSQLQEITIAVEGPHFRVEKGQDVEVNSFSTVYALKPGGQVTFKNRFIAPRPEYVVQERKRNLAARNPETYPHQNRRQSTGLVVRSTDPDRRRST